MTQAEQGDRSSARWWLPLAFGVEIALFLPALLGQGLIRSPLPKISESTNLLYLWQMLWTDEVLAGRLPFWNSYTYGGMPTFADPNVFTFYPAHLLALVLSPERAFTAAFLLHVMLASWLMYRLVREVGANRFGASVAALTYGLHAQLVGYIYAGWIHHVIPMALAPGVIWLLVRAFRDPRPWPGGPIAGASALLGLQIVGGHPEWVRYTLFILVMLTVAAAKLRRSLRARLVIGGAVIVLGMLVGGLQLLPLVEATRQSVRGQHALSSSVVRTGAGLPLLTLPTIVAPRLFGPWDETVSVDGLVHKLSGSLVSYSESLIYVGVLPLLLAILAWRHRRDNGGGVWAGIAVAGVLLALNDWTHLQSAIDKVVPLDAAFRSPARFVFLTNLSLCVLAGLGITSLTRNSRHAAFLGRVAFGIAGALAVGGALVWMARLPLVSWALTRVRVPASILQDPLVAADGGRTLGVWAVTHVGIAAMSAAVVVLASGAVLIWIGRRSRPLTQAAVIACVAADLCWFAYPLLRQVVSADAAYAADAALLAPIAGHVSARVAPTGTLSFVAGANANMALRVRSLGGYHSFILEGWERLARVALDGAPETLAAAGVTHVLTSGPNQKTVLAALPRPRGHAWWTNRVRLAPTADAAAAMLPELAPLRAVALETGAVGAEARAEARASTDTAEAAVRIEEDVPGKLRAVVESPSDGWLVVTEIFYPGWTARVNGRPARVERAFGTMQAVAVPAGVSTVEVAFRPVIALWGAGMTVFGLAIGVAGWQIGRRRRA